MLQLVYLLTFDIFCLAAWIGPTEWMFRRGWRLWPRLYAFVVGALASLMPIAAVAVRPITNNWVLIPAVASACVTMFGSIALWGIVIKGTAPLSAGKEARKWIFQKIEKRAYTFIVLLPAAGVYGGLISSGVNDHSAVTASGYVAGLCAVCGPYLVPTRKKKALRNYGSLRYIERTATAPVIITLCVVEAIGIVILYKLGLTIERAPLAATGPVLFIWRWALRPVREGDFEFEIEDEISYWHALDLQDALKRAKLVDSGSPLSAVEAEALAIPEVRNALPEGVSSPSGI